MTIIHVPYFRGIVPRTAARKLNDYSGQIARNIELWSRELRPTRTNLVLNTPTKSGEIQTIYPLAGKWLHWPFDVDVAPSPLQNNQNGRIYYSGEYNPKATDELLAIDGAGTDYPLKYYRLGVPVPDTAPTVVPSGGSGVADTRNYVYTFVTEWGEEGPPSPPTEATGKVDDTWALSSMDVAPTNALVISNITFQASTVTLVFTTQHFLVTGDYLTIAGFMHLTDLNGIHSVTRLDSTTITLPIATTQRWDIVNNGAFDADTSWAKGVGWSIAAGVASSDGSQTADSDLSQIGVITAGVTYDLSVTVSGYSAGNVSMVLGDQESALYSANGTHTASLTPTSGTTVAIRADLDFIGNADDFSIKESLTGVTVNRESPINTANMKKWIYRTVNAEYRFVAEVDVATTTYNDTLADIVLGETLPSADWDSPRGGLKGLTVLESGVFAGFVDNILCFSPPYVPHAWPRKYELTFPYKIVGIVSSGGAIIVGTKGEPYIVVGYEPETMSEAKLEFNHACSSKRSMRKVMNGAIYAAPDGLAYVPAAGTPRIISKPWMTKKDWDLYNPSSMHAHVHDDRYYAFYSGGGVDENESAAIVFDPSETDSTLTELDIQATAGYTSVITDDLFLMTGSNIVQWEKGGGYRTYEWRSKVFTLPKQLCFSAAMVRLTFGNGIPLPEYLAAVQAAIQAVDDKIEKDGQIYTGAFAGYMPGQYTVAGGPYIEAVNEVGGPYVEGDPEPGASISAIFRLYKNGELFFEKQLSNSKPFRLPVGKRTDTIEFSISASDVHVHEVFIAETMSELAGR